ncbi:type II toxin-antitoxin system RelE/ParE family toxin [Listeria booriae]|uniref:type II toxin-antitoxin system RelE/ParE family toxin n=1 Tax=Listeria booriae TaxID=1552123 RepID=UPI0016283A50|nr:type II toxin-antitoxin system RelE/ParE family toxin [Listeria booriae]MBC2321991.1 type II toxin-antitoxin system RelE/ParE family toxin [Listeria booriae]MCD2205494.1 type II toxin-antitoxin system RelE/ParE family toxin [Listeria booriae]
MERGITIKFSRHASLDYDRISLYLTEDVYQFQAEQNFSKAIEALLLNLTAFPKMGSVYDDGRCLSREYRRINVDRYSVFYVYLEDEAVVEIHRILAGMADHTIFIKDETQMYDI